MEGIYGHYDATSQSVSITSDVMMTTHTKHSIPDNRAMRMSHAAEVEWELGIYAPSRKRTSDNETLWPRALSSLLILYVPFHVIQSTRMSDTTIVEGAMILTAR